MVFKLLYEKILPKSSFISKIKIKKTNILCYMFFLFNFAEDDSQESEHIEDGRLYIVLYSNSLAGISVLEFFHFVLNSSA